MRIHTRLTAFRTALVVLTLLLPAAVRAQGFVSPLLGFDFGGDSGCPQIAGCENKKLNVGIGLGTMGRVFGAELDGSYARNFFGTGPGYSSSVLTVMGNVLVGPQLGPVRPYGTVGVGLIKSHVELTPAALLDATSDRFGWNIGGGVMIFPTEHVGVRGDIRHFHAFQDLNILGLLPGEATLDFGRAGAALVFRF